MKFNVITPSPILYPFIQYIWTAEGEEDTYRQFFCADANAKMIFSKGSVFTYHSQLNMHHSYKRVKIKDFDDYLNHRCIDATFAGLIGPSKDYSIIRVEGKLDMVGVKFTEVGTYFMLSSQPSEVRDSFVQIEQIKDGELMSVWNEIRQQEDINARIASLITFFSANLRITDREREDAELLKSIFLRYDSNATVRDIAKDACLCERQLRRLCHKYVGMSIADVLTLRRFHSAMLLLAGQEHSLSNTIANEYYDQSHMDREFDRYCGHTPSAMKTHLETSKWLHESTPLVKMNPNNVIMMV